MSLRVNAKQKHFAETGSAFDATEISKIKVIQLSFSSSIF